MSERSSTVPAGQADTIYFGGDIVTVTDGVVSPPQAVAVKDGRIVFVGSRTEAFENWDTSGTAVRRDLNGAALLPGFIDAHAHLGGIGLQATIANLLAEPDGDVTNIASLQDKLRRWYASFPIIGKPGWIVGFGYDDAMLSGRRHPTSEDLDQVSTTVPVLAIHQSFHLGAVNSKGLELLGYSGATPDPDGGIIRRRNSPESPEFLRPYGEPNGVLEETAFSPASEKAIDALPLAPKLNLLVKGRQAAASFGFTTVQDGGQTLETIATMRGLSFKLDVVAYAKADEVIELPGDPLGASQEYVKGLRVAGIKMYLDGSPQGRTAWLTEPYLQRPEGTPEGYAGYPTIPNVQDVLKQVRRGFQEGWQVIAHVNGDAAIDQFIRAVRAATQEFGPADRRTVAIHSQTARADQLDDFQSLGIIPSFFPMHTFYWGDWYTNTVLGEDRAQNISPARWALERQMLYTAHHDAPVALPTSIGILASQVTRITRSGRILGPHQRVSALDAVKSITINAAYQYFEEDRKGSIETGKLADLVILSANPLTVPAEDIKNITIIETIKAGKKIHPETSRDQNQDETVPSPLCLHTHC